MPAMASASCRSLQAGPDRDHTAIPDGEHVVVTVLGLPHPDDIYPRSAPAHHDSVTVGDDFLQLRCQPALGLPLDGGLQFAAAVTNLRLRVCEARIEM